MHGNLKGFYFFHSSFLHPLLVEGHVWGSSGARARSLFPLHAGNGKLSIIHGAEGASVTPFLSPRLMLLGLFLISEFPPYRCVTGGAGRVLTALVFQFPSRKSIVVKCS